MPPFTHSFHSLCALRLRTGGDGRAGRLAAGRPAGGRVDDGSRDCDLLISAQTTKVNERISKAHFLQLQGRDISQSPRILRVWESSTNLWTKLLARKVAGTSLNACTFLSLPAPCIGLRISQSCLGGSIEKTLGDLYSRGKYIKHLVLSSFSSRLSKLTCDAAQCQGKVLSVGDYTVCL
jgi:hypothetical protein